ncbi:hypothetical protein HY639_03740, partial [Candidatus Woesearchaeota archaeon]|nr:hypothetical protein [Candidatus Woesearchaeota archaeon]
MAKEAVFVEHKKDVSGKTIGNIYVRKGWEEEYNEKCCHTRYLGEIAELTLDSIFLVNHGIYDPKTEQGVRIKPGDVNILEAGITYWDEKRNSYAGYRSHGMAPVGLISVSYSPPNSDKETERFFTHKWNGLTKGFRWQQIKSPVHQATKRLDHLVKEYPKEEHYCVDEWIDYQGHRFHKAIDGRTRGEQTSERMYLTDLLHVEYSRHALKIVQDQEQTNEKPFIPYHRSAIFQHHDADFLLDVIKEWREEFVDNPYAQL